MVEVRYTWSALGEPAKWDGMEETEVMLLVPNTNPKVRQAVIEPPRYFHDNDSFLLHHRFMYVQDGRENISDAFTEEIVSREIEYLDQEGRITEVRLLWGVDSWNAPNWTQAKLEGLNLQTLPDRAGHDREGEGITDDAIYELIQTVPLPRRYVGKVWGPRSANVEYRYQLLRTNSPLPEDDFEIWITDDGQNFRASLQ